MYVCMPVNLDKNEQDKWKRDYEDKPRMKKEIKYIARKNSQLLFDYKEKFPDFVLASSAHNYIYIINSC